jgi:hypothetical protein
LNLAQGQNGLMIAALFGGAMLLLDRRPILAGILIGLMSCKPQFGLLIPIALVCGRRWTTFAAAALTTLAFAAVSLLAFGTEDWLAFFANLEFATAVLEDGRLPWAKMPSIFAALRLLGTPVDWAYAAQGATALGVAAAVALVWWRRAPLPLAAAVLTSGSLLVSPHVNDHDLALLAVPIALLAWHGQQAGWWRGEREILALAWLAPVITAIVAEPTHLQVGVLCLLALFALAVKRALASQLARSGASGANGLDLRWRALDRPALPRAAPDGLQVSLALLPTNDPGLPLRAHLRGLHRRRHLAQRQQLWRLGRLAGARQGLGGGGLHADGGPAGRQLSATSSLRSPASLPSPRPNSTTFAAKAAR